MENAKASLKQAGINSVASRGKSLTIGEAKELYKQYGPALYTDDAGLLEIFKRNSVEDGFRNDSYVHALFLTELMLQNTRFSFKMLTGKEGDGFLGTLKEDFVKMLRRFKKHQGKAQIVIADSEEPKFLRKLKSDYPDNLKVRSAEPAKGAQIEHFIVSDDSMVREEEPHEPLMDTMDAKGAVRATVYFSNSVKAKLVSQQFDGLWDYLAPEEES